MTKTVLENKSPAELLEFVLERRARYLSGSTRTLRKQCKAHGKDADLLQQQAIQLISKSMTGLSDVRVTARRLDLYENLITWRNKQTVGDIKVLYILPLLSQIGTLFLHDYFLDGAQPVNVYTNSSLQSRKRERVLRDLDWFNETIAHLYSFSSDIEIHSFFDVIAVDALLDKNFAPVPVNTADSKGKARAVDQLPSTASTRTVAANTMPSTSKPVSGSGKHNESTQAATLTASPVASTSKIQINGSNNTPASIAAVKRKADDDLSSRPKKRAHQSIKGSQDMSSEIDKGESTASKPPPADLRPPSKPPLPHGLRPQAASLPKFNKDKPHLDLEATKTRQADSAQISQKTPVFDWSAKDSLAAPGERHTVASVSRPSFVSSTKNKLSPYSQAQSAPEKETILVVSQAMRPKLLSGLSSANATESPVTSPGPVKQALDKEAPQDHSAAKDSPTIAPVATQISMGSISTPLPSVQHGVQRAKVPVQSSTHNAAKGSPRAVPESRHEAMDQMRPTLDKNAVGRFVTHSIGSSKKTEMVTPQRAKHQPQSPMQVNPRSTSTRREINSSPASEIEEGELIIADLKVAAESALKGQAPAGGDDDDDDRINEANSHILSGVDRKDAYLEHQRNPVPSVSQTNKDHAIAAVADLPAHPPIARKRETINGAAGSPDQTSPPTAVRLDPEDRRGASAIAPSPVTAVDFSKAQTAISQPAAPASLSLQEKPNETASSNPLPEATTKAPSEVSDAMSKQVASQPRVRGMSLLGKGVDMARKALGYITFDSSNPVEDGKEDTDHLVNKSLIEASPKSITSESIQNGTSNDLTSEAASNAVEVHVIPASPARAPAVINEQHASSPSSSSVTSYGSAIDRNLAKLEAAFDLIDSVRAEAEPQYPPLMHYKFTTAQAEAEELAKARWRNPMEPLAPTIHAPISVVQPFLRSPVMTPFPVVSVLVSTVSSPAAPSPTAAPIGLHLPLSMTRKLCPIQEMPKALSSIQGCTCPACSRRRSRYSEDILNQHKQRDEQQSKERKEGTQELLRSFSLPQAVAKKKATKQTLTKVSTNAAHKNSASQALSKRGVSASKTSDPTPLRHISIAQTASTDPLHIINQMDQRRSPPKINSTNPLTIPSQAGLSSYPQLEKGQSKSREEQSAVSAAATNQEAGVRLQRNVPSRSTLESGVARKGHAREITVANANSNTEIRVPSHAHRKHRSLPPEQVLYSEMLERYMSTGEKLVFPPNPSLTPEEAERAGSASIENLLASSAWYTQTKHHKATADHFSNDVNMRKTILSTAIKLMDEANPNFLYSIILCGERVLTIQVRRNLQVFLQSLYLSATSLLQAQIRSFIDSAAYLSVTSHAWLVAQITERTDPTAPDLHAPLRSLLHGMIRGEYKLVKDRLTAYVSMGSIYFGYYLPEPLPPSLLATHSSVNGQGRVLSSAVGRPDASKTLCQPPCTNCTQAKLKCERNQNSVSCAACDRYNFRCDLPEARFTSRTTASAYSSFAQSQSAESATAPLPAAASTSQPLPAAKFTSDITAAPHPAPVRLSQSVGAAISSIPTSPIQETETDQTVKGGPIGKRPHSASAVPSNLKPPSQPSRSTSLERPSTSKESKKGALLQMPFVEIVNIPTTFSQGNQSQKTSRRQHSRAFDRPYRAKVPERNANANTNSQTVTDRRLTEVPPKELVVAQGIPAPAVEASTPLVLL